MKLVDVSANGHPYGNGQSEYHSQQSSLRTTNILCLTEQLSLSSRKCCDHGGFHLTRTNRQRIGRFTALTYDWPSCGNGGSEKVHSNDGAEGRSEHAEDDLHESAAHFLQREAHPETGNTVQNSCKRKVGAWVKSRLSRLFNQLCAPRRYEKTFSRFRQHPNALDCCGFLFLTSDLTNDFENDRFLFFRKIVQLPLHEVLPCYGSRSVQ